MNLDDVLCRYKATGIRLDSGDLAYLSCEARKFFVAIENDFGVPGFGKTAITASNDLNEETLDALNKQGHKVDAFQRCVTMIEPRLVIWNHLEAISTKREAVRYPFKGSHLLLSLLGMH
ncbi:hypothetical protein SO802_022739 [Lithocarpus litseifolius]|uniref:nicotinate phosphoribosyltransferase n=1 Tax=Lithocarpus litseifolius TaxID=425828 RepID=A0AAW2C4A2_9ROSI